MQFDGMNPNLKEASTKGGMKRTVTFEIDQDTYDALKGFNHAGMIVSGELEVEDGHMFEPKEVKPKGGKLSMAAARFCEMEQFQKYISSHSHRTPRDYIIDFCGVSSRSQIDHNENAAKAFDVLVHEFNNWLKTNK